jgi:hypothetical protein
VVEELLGRAVEPAVVAQVELDHHRDGDGRVRVEADPLPLLRVEQGVGDDRPLDQGPVPAASPFPGGWLLGRLVLWHGASGGR